MDIKELPKTQSDCFSAPWRRFLIGNSPAILQLCEVIGLIASRRVTVMVSGETGTGKGVVASAIHAASSRRALPMVSVNCTALPATLVESELFGHAKGAFTGAHASRIGRFEQANHSTLFLDEIGDLPLEGQSKLLRVLQEQEFERVGSSETLRVDVRVIAASNVDLEKAVLERRFREDLYYRLNVVPIHMVPVRERREDIPLLLDYFLEKTRVAEAVAPKQITDEALDFLMQQDWPGNVRQLEHVVQMAFALSGDRYNLQAQDFVARGRNFRTFTGVQSTAAQIVSVGANGLDFDLAVSNFERSLLNQALGLSRGNKARAADLLHIKRTTLLAKLKTLDERLGKTMDTTENTTKTPVGYDPIVDSNAPDERNQKHERLEEVPPRADASQPQKRVSAVTPATALVVGPDNAIRRLVVKTLEREGLRALEADSSPRTLRVLECPRDSVRAFFDGR